MAWIIVWANGEELTRLQLSKPVVIGRAGECDLSVRDPMMSRQHCRIESLGRGWRIVDLGSKNGTRVGWQRVQAHVLRDGDWLRIGRTRLTFYTGPFQPGAAKPRPLSDRTVRPADPHEALSGTVTDFVLLDDDDHPDAMGEESAGMPSPQPRPLDPVSYGEPAVETLLEALASSAAEIEYASHGSSAPAATLERRRTRIRALPRVGKRPVFRSISPAEADEAECSLQADEQSLPAARITAKPRQTRLWTVLGIGAAAIIGTAVVIMSAWLLTLAP